MMDERLLDRRLRARAGAEDCPVPPDFEARLEEQLERLPRRRRLRPGRTALAAAAVCAALMVSALAYGMGALEFLAGREEYRFLGGAEQYEQYAQFAGLSRTAANGDVLTIDYLAADENFCTVFYTLRTAEPMEAWSQRDALPISPEAPDLWQAGGLAPRFTLEVSGAAARAQDGQQYLLDAHTLCGMARLTLREPGALGGGREVVLRAGPSTAAWDGDPRWEGVPWEEAEQWTFSLDLEPLPGETFSLDGPAALGERQVEALRLTISPLGSVLRCRVAVPEACRSDPGLWGGLGRFVARDRESGRYIPYTVLDSGPSEDGTCREESYLLCGGLEEVHELEILPAELEGNYTAVDLEELPYRGWGAYAASSFSVSEERMVLTLTPTGAVGNTGYSGTAAYFLDRNGEKLFQDPNCPDLYLNRYTDERDGSVTVTWSLTGTARAEAEEIAALVLYEETYRPAEGGGLTLTLSP